MMQRINLNKTCRAGILKTEVMLSLFLLVVAMNIASPLIHRVNLLWMDTQKHQFAINELANQMDALSGTPLHELDEALASLDVSQACKETLSDAQVTGSSKSDQLGTRITLELTWKERKNSDPIRLSAWLMNPDGNEGASP